TWSVYTLAVPAEDVGTVSCEFEGAGVDPSRSADPEPVHSMDGVDYYDVYTLTAGTGEITVHCEGTEALGISELGMGGAVISAVVGLVLPIGLGVLALALTIWGVVALVGSSSPRCAAGPPRAAAWLGDDLGPLELLRVQVAGGRHGVAQRAHGVGGAVGGDRGSEEDLLERCDRAHADPVAAGECGVVGLAAPVVAVPRGLLGPGQRRPDHQAVRTAGDGLDQIARAAQAAVGDHVHVAAAGFVHVVAAGGGDIGHRTGQRDGDPQGLLGGLGRAAAEADEDAGRAGAHQVQGRGVGGAAADDHRDVQLVDEALEVQRFAVRGDVLGGDGG